MGAYLIIFPDKVYLNTKDLSDYGSLECERTASAGVAISLCDAEGTAYSGVVQSAGAPEDPEEGTLWMDVSGQSRCCGNTARSAGRPCRMCA